MRVLIIAALLAGGLFVNAGVAWWRAVGDSGLPRVSDRSMSLRIAEVRRWIDRSPGDRILQYAPSRVGSSMGVTRTVIEAEPPLLPQRWHRVLVVEAGWPLPALAGERWSARDEGGANTGQDTVMLVSALDASSMIDSAAVSESAIIPLRPIWPGLATNSALYAIGLWLALVILPRTLRTMIRRRGGRCPACGRHLPSDARAGCSSCGWLRGLSNWREISGR
jgi:hypothetical protein